MGRTENNQLKELLKASVRSRGTPFSDSEIERFVTYYDLVLAWNSRLHLTTLIDPSSFFHRHILESDFVETLLLPSIEQIWDLGTGLGVPGIPLGILRPDLVVNLVEVKRNKTIFLEEACESLALTNSHVVEARLESLESLSAHSCPVARAVERMESVIKHMISIGRDCQQLLFLGSEDLREIIFAELDQKFKVKSHSIPHSHSRYVFSVFRST